MAERDPNRPRGCTCFRMRRVSRQMTRVYDNHLAPMGLTLTQYSLLSHLAWLSDKPPTVHELADIMSMDRTTLTRTLKPMMTAKLVAFAPGADRRSKCVALTATGHSTFERAKPLWRQAQEEMNSRLGATRVAELHKLLDESLTALAEA